MPNNRKEELVIRLIHRNLVFVVVAVVVISSLVFLNRYRGDLLGPIVDNGLKDFTLIWRISDHQNDDSLLQNSLLKTIDNPKYEGDAVIKLKRNADGGLEALPRLQGELEYCTTNRCQ